MRFWGDSSLIITARLSTYDDNDDGSWVRIACHNRTTFKKMDMKTETSPEMPDLKGRYLCHQICKCVLNWIMRLIIGKLCVVVLFPLGYNMDSLGNVFWETIITCLKTDSFIFRINSFGCRTFLRAIKITHLKSRKNF